MLGIHVGVDRSSFLWRPLTPRQRGMMVAVALVLVPSVALAAFLAMILQQSFTGTASTVPNVQWVVGTKSCIVTGLGGCSVSDGVGNRPEISLTGFDDDTSIEVRANVQNGTGAVCIAPPTSSDPAIVVVGLGMSGFSGQPRILTGALEQIRLQYTFPGATPGGVLNALVDLTFNPGAADPCP